MAHMTFIHGITNNLPPTLMDVWWRGLADANGLDLGPEA